MTDTMVTCLTSGKIRQSIWKTVLLIFSTMSSSRYKLM